MGQRLNRCVHNFNLLPQATAEPLPGSCACLLPKAWDPPAATPSLEPTRLCSTPSTTRPAGLPYHPDSWCVLFLHWRRTDMAYHLRPLSISWFDLTMQFLNPQMSRTPPNQASSLTFHAEHTPGQNSNGISLLNSTSMVPLATSGLRSLAVRIYEIQQESWEGDPRHMPQRCYRTMEIGHEQCEPVQWDAANFTVPASLGGGHSGMTHAQMLVLHLKVRR